MTLEVKGVHYDLTDKTKDKIDKKLKRLGYAEEFLTDLRIGITHDSNGYAAEANYHFRWGTTGHLKMESYKLNQAIDQLFDKLDHNIQKEKEKVRDTHQ